MGYNFRYVIELDENKIIADGNTRLKTSRLVLTKVTQKPDGRRSTV